MMKTTCSLQMILDTLRLLRVCGLLITMLCLGTRLGWTATGDAPDVDPPASADLEIMLEGVDVTGDPVSLGHSEGEEIAWLGVSTEEAPDLLTSHLKLEPGAGLVVTFVADDSPAASAGLTKNDLLVEFEGHLLVHPSQLQKLVQSRKPGDAVDLAYYRNGERQTTEVTLKPSPGWSLADPKAWQEHLRGFEQQFKEMHMGEAWQRQMQEWERSMKHLQGEQGRIQEHVQRAMEEAQRAANDPGVQEQIQRAIEQSMKAVEKGMRAAERQHFTPHLLPNQPGPRVTVRSSAESTQSLVHADDSGTYVLVRNPRLRLTVHDPEGTLRFDGEIETEEQQAGVPDDVWEKVKPLLDRLDGTR